MKRGAWLVGLLLAAPVFAQPPSGDAILARVDANIGSDNKVSHARMIIEGRGATRTIEISAPGVLAPVTPDIYEPVLTELASMDIVCQERHETLGAEKPGAGAKRKPPRRR